ncbi:hypothetical protein RRG08_018241 [Elysia crispata]|uniref:Uncharacterized protein n=1 Tax=Elysia crispata TaxID=231223 RepID=A0AAE1AU29_9GAST|nr:hypothetical protein RRG08_018241 [Elysia crispata]
MFLLVLHDTSASGLFLVVRTHTSSPGLFLLVQQDTRSAGLILQSRTVQEGHFTWDSLGEATRPNLPEIFKLLGPKFVMVLTKPSNTARCTVFLTAISSLQATVACNTAVDSFTHLRDTSDSPAFTALKTHTLSEDFSSSEKHEVSTPRKDPPLWRGPGKSPGDKLQESCPNCLVSTTNDNHLLFLQWCKCRCDTYPYFLPWLCGFDARSHLPVAVQGSNPSAFRTQIAAINPKLALSSDTAKLSSSVHAVIFSATC